MAAHWGLLDKSGPPHPTLGTPCWIWTGTRNRGGYGWGPGGKVAHRLAWELANGPIPAGMFVCHKCDNRPCCNPAHLFLGTHIDNMADMRAKGRSPRKLGAAGNGAKLNETSVREIRALAQRGVQQKEIARMYGVTAPCVYLIVTRRRWAHLA